MYMASARGSIGVSERQILKATRPASTRKIKPRIWCQREFKGFTAAGTTCFTNWPDCLAAGAHCVESVEDCFCATERATGSHRPANRPAARAISSVRTTQFYQTEVLYQRRGDCTIK